MDSYENESADVEGSPTRPIGTEFAVLEGWLEKHGDWLGQWNRRYFRLRGPVLSYKTEPHLPDKGMCHLHGIRTEKQNQHIRVWTERSDSWLLRAPDEETHKRWLEALKVSLLAHENRVTGSNSKSLLRSDSNASLDSADEAPAGSDRPTRKRSNSHRRSIGVTPEDEAAARAQQRKHQLLRGPVKKRSAWLRKWNDRFMVIDGVDMLYSEKEDGGARGRHTIVAVDPVEEPTETEVRISTTSEDFHVRLPGATVAKQWIQEIRSSLQETMTLRWQIVEPQNSDGSNVYLRAANHAACVYDRGGATHVSLVLYGGMSSTLPASAKAEEKAILCNEVVTVRLSGDHDSVKLNPRAFSEGPGAVVKPTAREGHACVIAGTKVYFHGGANRNAVLSDMWCLDLAQPLAQLEWFRVSNPAHPVVPALCGHTMINMDDDIWFIGGFDVHGQASTDVFSLDPNQGSAVVKQPSLPRPRARHACAANSSGTILVVGGTESRLLADACNKGFLLCQGDTEWSEVEWLGIEVPKMVSPCLTPVGRKGWLLLGSDGHTSVQVYLLLPSKTKRGGVNVEHLSCGGDSPRMVHGLSAHLHGEYLYIVGDSSLPPIGPAVRRLLLPPSVVRHAPRMPSMGSMADLHDHPPQDHAQ